MDGMTHFVLFIASVVQISNIVRGDDKGFIWPLSFSVLIIFLHIVSWVTVHVYAHLRAKANDIFPYSPDINQVFEFRVNKGVCHFVAVVVRIAGQVQVFFLIFAFGILAFAIAILHLLHGCPVDVCEGSDVQFPFNILKAISATYFFMVSMSLSYQGYIFELAVVLTMILDLRVESGIPLAIILRKATGHSTS